MYEIFFFEQGLLKFGRFINIFIQLLKAYGQLNVRMETFERFVWIRVNFLCISAIDTKNQKFSAEVLIEARWRPAKDEDTTYFDPKLMISNMENVRREKFWHRFETSDQNKWAYLCWRLTGDFYENMELENFPRDVQDLSISVSSERHADEIELLVEDKKLPTVDVNNFRANQEWRLFTHVEAEKLPETPNSDVELGSTAGFIVGKCRVSRRSQYFFLNNVLVMFCLLILSLTIFAFDPRFNMSRIGASINLLLVGVAFKLSVSANLPLISYLTYLDVYMLGVILYLCLNIILFAFLSLLKDAYETARTADKIAVSVLLTAITVTHICYGFIFMKRTNIPILEMNAKDVNYSQLLQSLRQRKESHVVKVVAKQIPPPRNWHVTSGYPRSSLDNRLFPRGEENGYLLPLQMNDIRRQGNLLQSL